MRRLESGAGSGARGRGSQPRLREATGLPSGPTMRACRCVRLDADRMNGGESLRDQGGGIHPRPAPEERSEVKSRRRGAPKGVRSPQGERDLE